MSDGKITIKTPAQHELMRIAGNLVGRTLNMLGGLVRPGVSTLELNDVADEFIRKNGGIPSFLNYQGYPKSICASVNDQVVHGIPNRRVKLKEGDIISIDIGAIVDGFHGDAARTFAVGNISDEARDLIRVTQECFFEGFEQAVVGNHISDISAAVENHARMHGYGVVRDLVGHGIGSNMHEAPEVPNFVNIHMGRGARLVEGMAIAVEPMINLGSGSVRILPDGWTCVTKDGKLSAHYENTIFITKNGPEILTNPEC